MPVQKKKKRKKIYKAVFAGLGDKAQGHPRASEDTHQQSLFWGAELVHEFEYKQQPIKQYIFRLNSWHIATKKAKGSPQEELWPKNPHRFLKLSQSETPGKFLHCFYSKSTQKICLLLIWHLCRNEKPNHLYVH